MALCLRCVLSILLAVAVVRSQDLPERYRSFGTLLLPQCSTAPFPHPVRSTGHTYGGKQYPKEFHYSDSTVAIFIPKHFQPGNAVDIVVYLHGWYNAIDSALAQFRLIEQFTESRRNAVFVFPEGPKRAPDSFAGRLEETGGLQRLIDDVMSELRRSGAVSQQQPGQIVLAGHSGAFRGIAFMLMRGGVTERISDVILFDALYGETEKYAYWLDHFRGRFVNIYTDDGGTKGESEDLIADLDAWKIPCYASPESTLTMERLKSERILFIHSDLDHNGVIAERDQFRRFLETGPLRPGP